MYQENLYKSFEKNKSFKILQNLTIYTIFIIFSKTNKFVEICWKN